MFCRWELYDKLIIDLFNSRMKIIKLPKEPKKKKLIDLTLEEYKKWFKINCETNHICRKCIFGCVDCDDLSLRCWIHHKDLYSDKFLDQEIEVEEE